MIPRLLLIDNYDSFTYNLADYLLQLGVRCTVVRNDDAAMACLGEIECDGVVLSPGPQTPVEAGFLMDAVHFYATRRPVLGVCLGHQALGQHFGGRVRRAVRPMHGKASMIRHEGHWLFEGLGDRFQAMRYHSLVVDNLEGSGLRAIAWAPDGEIMALEHQELPLVGVQFHPESILTIGGKALLNNWIARLSDRSPVVYPPDRDQEAKGQ